MTRLIFIALLFTGIAFGQKTVDFEKLPKDQLKGLKVTTDKFTGATSIHSKGASQNSTQMYILFKDGQAALRIINLYRGKDWIFFDKMMYILDGVTYEYPVDAVRETQSGGVIEYSDKEVTPEILAMLNKFDSQKKNIEYRFSGSKGIRDWTLKKNYLYYITDILDLYNSL